MKIISIIISLLFLVFSGSSVAVAEKAIIGEPAWIEVESVPFNYLARIDTGARATSIHALDVEVIDGSTTPDENIGKQVFFRTLNRDGKSKELVLDIVKVATVFF